MKKDNLKKGNFGEDLAAEYLAKKGYKIIKRNYKTKYAETDIIALKKTTLTFVEVKSRSNKDFGRGYEAVDARKIHKIRTNATIFTSLCSIDYEAISFDIIEVYLNTGEINHIMSAF